MRLSDLEQIMFSQQWGSLYSFITDEEGKVIIHPRLTPSAEVCRVTAQTLKLILFLCGLRYMCYNWYSICVVNY